MGSRVGLGMLAVLLLLTVSVSDGMVTTKCELVNQLMAIIPPDVPDRESQVAKIVCHAEVTSHFDTSVTNQVPPVDLPGGRKTRGATPPPKTTLKTGAKTTTKSPPKTTTKSPPKTTTKPPPKTTTTPAPTTLHSPKVQNSTAFPKLPKMSTDPMNNTAPPFIPNFNNSENENHSDMAVPPTPPPPPNVDSANTNSRRKRGISEQWMLYGVFQLADRVACTSPQKKSFNVCNTSCTNLINDNTSDDVKCVWNIISNDSIRKTAPNNPNREETNKLVKTMRDMIMNTCPNVDYTQYLAECTP